MRPITFPLPRENQGAELGNLQDGLLILLDKLDNRVLEMGDEERVGFHEAIRSEQADQTYGRATKKVVRVLQERLQVDAGPTGTVNEQTAEALNRKLRQLGALDSARDAHKRFVAGQAVHHDHRPFKGMVVLFSEGGEGSIHLGEDATDPEGRFTIGYDGVSELNGARLRLSAFDVAEHRRADQTIEPRRPIEIVNLVVNDQDAVYRVAGKVASAARASVRGLRVVIVDKNVGPETLLSEAKTDEVGYYSSDFPYPGPKARPDVQARALRGEAIVGVSEVRYDADYVESSLDINVPEDAETALATEHESLTGDLAAHYHGALGDLQESGDRQDVTYLANKTGWDARAVALAALADQFSSRTADEAGNVGIQPALFYALFRAGVPANDEALCRTDPQTVQAIWKQGIQQGIVPPHLESAIPAAADKFLDSSVRQRLNGAVVAGVSTLKEMLSVSLPHADPAEQASRHEQFVKLQMEHHGEPERFWDAVNDRFGKPAAERLRLDGQLADLTLNNAPLIKKLHAADQTPLANPVDLVARGYHQPAKWRDVIPNDAVPAEIAGANEQQKRSNYAELLAAQLRLSYPTATVAALINSGDTPTSRAATRETRDAVHRFLVEHHGKFEIGMQPIAQYVARNQIPIEPQVQHEITRIQRVHQITPSDEAMNALLKRGVDSAYAVVRYNQDEFIKEFKQDVRGEANAALIYAKAQQVHNVVLNLATSYLVASSAPGIGVHSPPQIIQPAPNVPANPGDVIAYAAMETLFGEMDYCACEHCRSILSPAAYLVDLLQFLDRPTNEKENPQTVLLQRRPEIEHLPLTCENTNTPLPYIDVVNETLEYFVTNGLKLDNFTGHNTDGDVTTEELMANPQFVSATAYEVLAGKPANPGEAEPQLPPLPLLPFHEPLENLRRCFDKFDTSLAHVMETLRKDDAVEPADPAEYGWRDVWLEELRFSRAEYATLTDRTRTLQQLYGFPPATAVAEAIGALSDAKAFARRLDINYEELIEVLQTRFVNPQGGLIPKLERLGVTLKTLKDFKNGTMTDEQFEAALARHLDATQYGGDVKRWVKDQANYDKIMSLLVLIDPTGANDPNSFDKLEFRYADPARMADTIRPIEFVKLLRFIRLWRKLGWSIEQTDKAITALYPADQIPNDADESLNLQRLDAGFLSLLPRLGVIKRVMASLNLTLKKDLLSLLACYAPIDTYGAAPLYRQLFLNATLLQQDPVFADDGYGNFLGGSAKLMPHQESLRAALTLTANEFQRITAELDFNAETPLTVDTVSAVFRRRWLARKLRMSVQEFLLLTRHTGLDPFAMPQPANPAVLQLVDFVNRLRAASLSPSQALYLVWNRDLSGRAAPDAGQINEFARSLRAVFAAAESEFAIANDPDGHIARARMALVYDNATTDLFFGLLNNTLTTETSYSHYQGELEQLILDAAPGRIAYDDFRKRLTFAGVMTAALRDALKMGVPLAFEQAVDDLYKRNQKVVGAFFERFPELQSYYTAYVASSESVEKKRTSLLENFLPELKRRRKSRQALEAIGAAAGTESALASALLDAVAVLHAAANLKAPALGDLTAIEKAGLAAEFYFRDTAADRVDRTSDAEAILDYRAASDNKLPSNGGNPISAVWSGYLEAPASGSYNIRIEADAGASVTLTLDDTGVVLQQLGNRWSNTAPIELRAGTLYAFKLKVEMVSDSVRVQWQSSGRGWEVIPARYLYSSTLRDQLSETYVRFFKTVSLANAMRLTANEMAHLARHPDHQIEDQGWLNRLPVAGSPDEATSRALFKSLDALVDFARLKAKFAPDDERLLDVLKDPEAAAQMPDSPLFALTRWEPASLDALLARFGKTTADLTHIEICRRVFDAYTWATALGISAAALIKATTNEPSAATVRDLRAALRARYAESDWLNVIKPINDEMRGLRRDALVAYVLHQLRSHPASQHIDTADKLFEYFLMDVQMEPCMQTSRIRHALSSVQLFTERCLMNLEPRVAASSINAKQWQWMKRYRVWEANRKVFLWPENWLEPELRDDQSPLFKQTMSELLQGDITEDRAANALRDYLTKLDDVAKLEPCGIHFVENDPGTADDISHVVARTTGATKAYYYRRREHGYWTPWEHIKLDIEDNPVIPVVWKNRLFLFWLRILKQAPQTAQKPLNTELDRNLAAITTSEIRIAPSPITVQAILCWSEYFNGKWQPTKTSEVDKPTNLGNFSLGTNPFERSHLMLFASEEFSGGSNALRISIWNQGRSSFLLYNTHSSPVRKEDQAQQAPGGKIVATLAPATVDIDTSGETLTLAYTKAGLGVSGDLSRQVLKNPIPAETVQPQHTLRDAWAAPFFYADHNHAFYVSTTERSVLVGQSRGFVDVLPKPQAETPRIPPIVLQPRSPIPDRVGPVTFDHYDSLAVGSLVQRFVTEDAYIKKGLETTAAVRFGDKMLGPTGQVAAQRFQNT